MEAEGYNVVIPPGFRFKPTNEEIITYYLLKKVMNKPFPAFEFTVIDENQFYIEPPHRVADVNLFKKEDWYFMCPQSKKLHDGGTTLIRIVGNNKGYWKPSGTEKSIYDKDGNVIGFKNSLVYHSGVPNIGHVTPWVMEEYRLSEEHHKENIKAKDLWIMGRIRWNLKDNADKEEDTDEEEEEEEEEDTDSSE